LDACMHRAEEWVQAIARESGQRVDWHYSGGIANVIYLGDHAKVLDAVVKLTPMLDAPMPRLADQCGSCGGSEHRRGRIMRVFGDGSRGLFRRGDPVPDGALAVSAFDPTPPREGE
jgi:hypothetical protein